MDVVLLPVVVLEDELDVEVELELEEVEFGLVLEPGEVVEREEAVVVVELELVAGGQDSLSLTTVPWTGGAS